MFRLNDRAVGPRLMEYEIEDPIVSYDGGQDWGLEIERARDTTEWAELTASLEEEKNWH